MTQVIGAVVDVQFDKDLPPIFNALEVVLSSLATRRMNVIAFDGPGLLVLAVNNRLCCASCFAL